MTVPSFETLFMAGRAVFLVFSFIVAAVTFTRWRRATAAQTDRIVAANETLLQRLADLEARVDATRLSVSKLGERLERSQPVASTLSSPSPGYQIAIRLARGGASREELIAGCGLSMHEAELIQRLHGPQAPPKSRKSAAAA